MKPEIKIGSRVRYVGPAVGYDPDLHYREGFVSIDYGNGQMVVDFIRMDAPSLVRVVDLEYVPTDVFGKLL